MKKINLFRGKNVLAAGMMGILLALGANAALAEEAAAVDMEGAEAIALADADITADQAERLATKMERENGEEVYEVSFLVEGIDHEYVIREADGAILEWEIDGRDIGDAVAEASLKKDSADSEADETESPENGDTLVGMERAKEAALQDAGLTEADVAFSKIKFEQGSRRVIYEVEFYYGRTEYEYTIDAYSAEVLKMERD